MFDLPGMRDELDLINGEANMTEITKDKKSQIFVFGSNLAGRHGKGAALYAYQHHGAIAPMFANSPDNCELPEGWR